MKCPYCLHFDSKVIDSRPTDEGSRIRRRRECLLCIKRFTTYEVVETTPIMVVKKDRSREEFDRDKLLASMLRACEKRTVTMKVLEDAVGSITTELQGTMDREVQSSMIGNLVMKHLEEIDEVAYVRFASVYRQFRDIGSFMDELQNMLSNRDAK
jgi:transcriptional repressor NrdR